MDYLSGHEPTFWTPDPPQKAFRFALGRAPRSSAGNQPLVAVGMNPSHADDKTADRTVNRIIQASIDHSYSGWIMLNLYPERATRPKDLRPYDHRLSAANCDAIAETVAAHGIIEALGAWGDIAHPTIRRAKADVLARLQALGVQVFSFDKPTVAGEPRHPTPRTGPLAMEGPKRHLD